jgi:hypothetical protein
MSRFKGYLQVISPVLIVCLIKEKHGSLSPGREGRKPEKRFAFSNALALLAGRGRIKADSSQLSAFSRQLIVFSDQHRHLPTIQNRMLESRL